MEITADCQKKVRQLRITAKGNSVYLDRENSREPFELLVVCSVVRTKLWSESPSDSLEVIDSKVESNAPNKLKY